MLWSHRWEDLEPKSGSESQGAHSTGAKGRAAFWLRRAGQQNGQISGLGGERSHVYSSPWGPAFFEPGSPQLDIEGDHLL